MVEHKEVYLKRNGKQTVKLKTTSIKFRNYFKQLPFKIYADFECNVKRVKSSDRGDRGDNTSCTGKNQKHFLAVLPTMLFVMMINLVNQMFFTEEKMRFIDLLKQF